MFCGGFIVFSVVGFLQFLLSLSLGFSLGFRWGFFAVLVGVGMYIMTINSTSKLAGDNTYYCTPGCCRYLK